MTFSGPGGEPPPTDGAPESVSAVLSPLAGMRLPMGVGPVVAPARPAALVVDLGEGHAAAATLDRLGCEQHLTTAQAALEFATRLGRFDLVLVTPEVIEDEDGEYLLRDLASVSPNARLLLVGPSSLLTTQTLLRGMRAGVHDVVDPSDAIALNTTLDKILTTADARAERVLAIGAHPDDVEIGCAGTLLEHRRRGDAVWILTMSHGAVGGDVEARLMESTSTARALGAGLMIGDLPDTRIDPGIETIREIEAVVAAIDPTIIYVHSPRDHHQDHRAVHAAVVSASRRVPQVFAYQSPSATNEFLPNKFVAIDSVVVRKVDLLGLFGSQSERSYLEPEMIVATARYWARNLAPRARYAEPFEIVRSLTPLVRRARDTDTRSPDTRNRDVAPVVSLHAEPKDTP